MKTRISRALHLFNTTVHFHRSLGDQCSRGNTLGHDSKLTQSNNDGRNLRGTITVKSKQPPRDSRRLEKHHTYAQDGSRRKSNVPDDAVRRDVF